MWFILKLFIYKHYEKKIEFLKLFINLTDPRVIVSIQVIQTWYLKMNIILGLKPSLSNRSTGDLTLI